MLGKRPLVWGSWARHGGRGTWDAGSGRVVVEENPRDADARMRIPAKVLEARGPDEDSWQLTQEIGSIMGIQGATLGARNRVCGSGRAYSVWGLRNEDHEDSIRSMERGRGILGDDTRRVQFGAWIRRTLLVPWSPERGIRNAGK